MPVRVSRAGSIPRLTDQEISTRDRFAQAAVAPLQALADSPYAALSAEEAQKLAAAWYEACAYVLHFSSLVQMEAFLRQEVSRIGTDPELKRLQGLLGAMNQTYRQIGWTADAVAEMETVAVGVLADMGLTKREVRESKPADVAAEKKTDRTAAAPTPQRPRRRVAMTARVQSAEFSDGIDEVVQTENVTREGILFYSSQPYKPGMRLSVILPYTKRSDEDKINTMMAEVARVERGGEKPTVEVRFVR